jgi:hypothetical protein|tara:strand:+ start:153 stop:701 length:549 start_codon:yes stop_codon:yes gene_type:complete
MLLAACCIAPAAADDENPVTELTPQALPGYQFERDETPAIVEDLSFGQRFTLDSQRKEMKDLVARRLGILRINQSTGDLNTIQQLVDRRVIGKGEVQQWQALGVIFGDILVKEMGLHWVSYKDKFGTSKALGWRETKNFVFPVTMFSRRVQFKQTIDAAAMYEKIKQEVTAFKQFEQRNLKI